MIGLMEVNAFEVNISADSKGEQNKENTINRIAKQIDLEGSKTLTKGFEVNTANLYSEESGGGRVRERGGMGRGVFPLLAMLNHSCYSNTRSEKARLPGWSEF